MSIRILRLSACWIFVIGVVPAQAESPTPSSAISRGLEFLQTDAMKWRKEHECSTCHHGTMTVWVLSEAKSRGDNIVPETFAENLKWAKDRFLAKIDQPRDTRPGHLMVNSAMLNLAVMACCVPEQAALSADERERVISYLLRHQEADGSWAWSSAPAENRPPPFFESDEVSREMTPRHAQSGTAVERRCDALAFDAQVARGGFCYSGTTIQVPARNTASLRQGDSSKERGRSW